MNEHLLQKVAQHRINFTEEDMFNCIRDRYRWPKHYPYDKDPQPSIECIIEEGAQHQNFFNTDGWVNSEKAIELYQEGYTLILSRIHYLHPEFYKFAKIVEELHGKEINANAYFSRGKKSISFPPHTHPYHVLVKNVFGSSLWELNGQEHIIDDQSIVFFEAETLHCVKEIYDSKLSLTFNLT